MAPEVWAHKSKVLDEHCARLGRDPATIERGANLGMAFTDDALRAQFGAIADFVRPGVLTGSSAEMVDRVGAYAQAGADWVILAMRAPFDRDGLERFAAEVLPQIV
jgi:alkanesulfonate monooxygenase SsuD/methylene tetrahydromethanopterin reductase-like flavin-dependent oxidoreductase (luciferase family)